MEKLELIRLNLGTPLVFGKIYPEKDDISTIFNENEEKLLCYNLNPVHSGSIEPIPDEFLGSLEFIGFKKREDLHEYAEEETVKLPNGVYLFMQKRSSQTLSQTEWLDIAIEQQKDGLWERNKLGNLLYVRFLHEDNAFVTQIFRKILQN